MVWIDVDRCGVVLIGVVWSGVMWSGVERCGVEWCRVVSSIAECCGVCVCGVE